MQNAAARNIQETVSFDVEAIREQAFRAGYGAGGDAVQREHRHRPFLIEDEAWSLFQDVRRP